MNDIARAINEKTNNDEERKALLINALADKFGTKKDNKYAMNSLGELYSKVKTSKPHSKDWYEALNNYDEAADVYRMVIGDDALDYYNTEIEKERMKPNSNEEKLDYEVVNDKAIDAIKDNFTPPGAKSKHEKAMENAEEVGIVDEMPEGWKEKEGVLTTPNGYKAISNGGSRFPKEGQKKHELKFIKDAVDTNDNGEIEVDEMADFQKSLDDYAAKNKKGRDDIPVTTRRR